MTRTDDGVPTIAVTGAAGLIGGILVPHLLERYRVRGIDVRPTPGPVQATRRTILDERALIDIFSGCRYVIHLATGASRQWEGLLEVDINGTRAVFDAAVTCGIDRMILASTNHVAGGLELDRVRSPTRQTHDCVGVVRPDSPYAAAKAFGEAYGRFIAETTPVRVSCLRMGSVRAAGNPADVDAGAEQRSDAFAHWPNELVTEDALARRLRRTWLSHEDLLRIVDEELQAPDRYRLRWAVSNNPGRFWPLDVYVWNP